MRALQNSASSTVPELGISRGIPLPQRHKRLSENARLRSELSSKHSSQLQVSNRERMAISRRPVSSFFQLRSSSPGPRKSNRKCRCVQHRHPEPPTGVEGSLLSLSSAPPTFSTSNRKSGIRIPPNGLQNQSHAIF